MEDISIDARKIFQKLMTAASYAVQHNQVLVAQQCFNEGSSSLLLCAEAIADSELRCFESFIEAQVTLPNINASNQ